MLQDAGDEQQAVCTGRGLHAWTAERLTAIPCCHLHCNYQPAPHMKQIDNFLIVDNSEAIIVV